MGVRYVAYALIGVRTRNPVVKARERGCAHGVTESKFCPECGKRTWSEVTRLHPALEAFEGDKEVGGLRLVTGGMSDDGYFVAAAVCKDDDYGGSGFLGPQDMGALWTRCRAYLEPHGLWDESQFGIHAVLYAG